MKMTLAEALKLHGELGEIAGGYPGSLRGAKERLRQIEFAFNCCSEMTTYFREKVSDAIHWVSIWRTEIKWRQWGSDPMRLEAIVQGSLLSMRSVIEQELLPAEQLSPKRSNSRS
jgi:hypothetical protein